MKPSHRTIDRLKQNYGNWVLITGATSGIGRELAIKFAEAGFSLVITGRREQLLNELCTEVFDKYKTEVVSLPGDLSRQEEVYELINETEHLPIGIVVLNAGYGTSGKFIDSDLNQELNMFDLNCRSVLMLTHRFANRFKQRQRKGAIVLLSSIVSFQGVPNAANYAASKAYVQSLGEALALEFAKENIDLLCAAPGPVATGFSERANMRMNQALKPEDVGIPIIEAIGRRKTLLPGSLTKFLAFNLGMVPRWAKIRIMGMVMTGFTKHQLNQGV